MCGLTGIFDLRATRDVSAKVLRRMNESQLHRGPDEGSLHLEPGLGLGHRRLSIIDVATGQQPLFNEDNSVCIVFNGEIYNYQELIPELQALGHTFRTRSDTEVIVHAWEAWGEACVQRLRGMFAFALYDRNRHTLFLARDRLGVKPLHYAITHDGWLLFGSELKSLLAYDDGRGGLPRRIDPMAVEEYMALGYVADPRTIYTGINKLEAAHTLTFRRGQAPGQPQPYWDVRFTLDAQCSAGEASEELLRRLDEAVKLRMVSEVPIGAFLSGGVDSSAVVASMALQSGQPVRTCAIGFDDPAFNESEFAAQVAARYRTDHHLEVASADDHDLIDTLADLYDEPFADSSALPTYRVCQLARRHVTVALSGDGGDETFGGYRRYRLHLMEEHARRRLPLGLRRPLFGLLGSMYPKLDWAPRPLRAKSTLQALAHNSVQAYLRAVSRLHDGERQALYSSRLRADLGGRNVSEVFERYANRAGTDDGLALVQYLDYKTWLVGDINTKVDRASMAHSLEVREPLMDHVLVEWMARLPSALKTSPSEGKLLLKRAHEARLPNEVLYRPKMGFSVPLARWLRGPLAQRLEKAVMGGALADSDLFEMGAVRQLLAQHQSGRRDRSSVLWSLLMFEAFLRRTHGGDGALPKSTASSAVLAA